MQESHRSRTFVKAFLTVHDGNSLMGHAGGSVKLTVVLVEFAVGPAHGFVMRLAAFQTLTFSFTGFSVHHTVLPQTTVLMFTGPGKATLTEEPCGDIKNKISLFEIQCKYGKPLHAMVTQH